jgi:hypothetical protein
MRRLQFYVERSSASATSIHWAEHLNVADGTKAETFRTFLRVRRKDMSRLMPIKAAIDRRAIVIACRCCDLR